MRAAYDALDSRTKAGGLICEHSLAFLREAIGFTDLTLEERMRSADPPAPGALPGDRPQVLFLSSHAGTIIGWTIRRRACSCAI